MTGHIQCRLCQGNSKFSFQKKILNKYQVSYYLCDDCGSLQTEKPYWLEEAYDPLNERFDTGQLVRSIHNASFLGALIAALQMEKELVLDYGCGSGLLTRLLRDVGLDAWGYDTYSIPRLAVGFQKATLEGAKIINLCEVVEHFDDPAKSFDELFAANPEVVVIQTVVFEALDPNWFYLAEDHGQHIFFYSPKSIEYLAKRHNMAATFISGYIVFFKTKYLDKLFVSGSSIITKNLKSLLDNAVSNLMQKFLSNGYTYPVKDNLLLKG